MQWVFQLQDGKSNTTCIKNVQLYLYKNKIKTRFVICRLVTEIFHMSAVERTMVAYPEYGGICYAWAFSILPVGMVTHSWAVEHNEVSFSDVSVTFPWQERLAQ